MKFTIFLTLIITLSGCSSQVQRPEPTHVWTASHKKLQLAFNDNDRSCASKASSVPSYESCMKSIGYSLR